MGKEWQLRDGFSNSESKAKALAGASRTYTNSVVQRKRQTGSPGPEPQVLWGLSPRKLGVRYEVSASLGVQLQWPLLHLMLRSHVFTFWCWGFFFFKHWESIESSVGNRSLYLVWRWHWQCWSFAAAEAALNLFFVSRGDILIVTALDKNLSRFVVRDVIDGGRYRVWGTKPQWPRRHNFFPINGSHFARMASEETPLGQENFLFL